MIVLRAPLGSLLKKILMFRPLLQAQVSKKHDYGNNPTIKLANGEEIPSLGLGTWKSCPSEVCESVKNAICIGYRHIDCGHVHENEKQVGVAIKAKIEDDTISRNNIFVTSKLWNTYHGDYTLVKQGLEQTLSDLSLPYVDLYLMQWPFGYRCGTELFPKDCCSGGAALNLHVHFCCVWKEMELLQKSGLTRMIGVSNFNANQVARILATAQIPPVMNQIECHPYLNQVQLSSSCMEKHVNITAHTPLGSPGTAKPGTSGPLCDPAVQCIANTHHKCAAQILIRYQIQRGHVVIPKSVCLEHIKQNYDVFDFCLSDVEMNQLTALEKGKNGRFVIECEAMAHPEYPFKELLCGA